MKKTKIYYQIRVIKAKTKKEAVDCVELGYFDEENKLCDKVFTKEELQKELKK